MVCPACTQDMIKSKVGHLCLNCGNLVEHGHSAIKPDHHEHEAHHEAHHEAKPEHHAVHEVKKPAPAKKPAAAKKSTSGTKRVKTRTVSDLRRTAHS